MEQLLNSFLFDGLQVDEFFIFPKQKVHDLLLRSDQFNSYVTLHKSSEADLSHNRLFCKINSLKKCQSQLWLEE